MMELMASTPTAWTPRPEIVFVEPVGRTSIGGNKGRAPVASSSNTSPSVEVVEFGSRSALWMPHTIGASNEPSEAPAVFGEIRDRFRSLDVIARDEKIGISSESLRDMLTFFGSTPLSRRPSIYLHDSGNYRAVWRNQSNEQVAIQFLGKDAAQFVIFKLASNGMMKRVAGSYPLSALYRQIEVNKAESLLRDG